MAQTRENALLVLEDGKTFSGYSFGATGETTGEVVFNTSMTGYQEILTDPSYKGQIVTMTYPLIGNYGVNEEDFESSRPWVEGFVVREYSKTYSNWRATRSLGDFLSEHGIVGIEGVDTRALTRHIRLKGAMKGVISTTNNDIEQLIGKAKEACGVINQDLVQNVSCSQAWWWKGEGDSRVVVIDCGVKRNILRLLAKLQCEVCIVPATMSAHDILSYNPGGVLISNGPGDPAAVSYVIDTVRLLIGKLPIFGICLGHQILGLALGGKTYKLKFGHHGGNHPVKDIRTNRIAITAQNHGFCLDTDTLPNGVEITHVNLYDQTLEGMRYEEERLFSTQFHPEAAPGPHDTALLFQQFITEVKKGLQ